ncbi:tRNA (adenosine(37)-N6)-threonylcarbamoyltransferase complex dimerization subunit type 1 TsaB [Ferviditalea candida]|uniref:tRNA (Adenosine(37)-N6)-threonylcarbamoyltransferase complex dimerization subunit type 1 TsaB n=1 Tax=Ferviditalea candida TaxID=3108399 RepID=A0ABU5ZEH5_9BACL|nr:tRNA (adenosine(37)-N6)-threonylcarbamoyltransferase complex dimerization subunit type 1 TsaB [Paenibacillaceae bacterium T2]
MEPSNSEQRLEGRLLALDTATSSMTVAVLENGKLLGERNSLAERNHSIRLVPAIGELLQSLGMTMKHIDAVAAGKGPGSYTGVRIGVTVAKTFAWTLSIPLLGISTLETLAYGGFDPALRERGFTQWVVPILDARRGQVYTGLYGDNGSGWVCMKEDGVRKMRDWALELREMLEKHRNEAPPHRILFVGEVEPFTGVIKILALHGKVETADQPVRAYHAGLLALERWKHGEFEAVHSFNPNYTQLAEAEKKLLAKQN